MGNSSPDLVVRPDIRAAAAVAVAKRAAEAAAEATVRRTVSFDPAPPKPRRAVSFAPPEACPTAEDIPEEDLSEVTTSSRRSSDVDEDDEDGMPKRRMPRTVTPHPRQMAASLARRAAANGAEDEDDDDDDEGDEDRDADVHVADEPSGEAAECEGAPSDQP